MKNGKSKALVKAAAYAGFILISVQCPLLWTNIEDFGPDQTKFSEVSQCLL